MIKVFPSVVLIYPFKIASFNFYSATLNLDLTVSRLLLAKKFGYLLTICDLLSAVWVLSVDYRKSPIELVILMKLP